MQVEQTRIPGRVDTIEKNAAGKTRDVLRVQPVVEPESVCGLVCSKDVLTEFKGYRLSGIVITEQVDIVADDAILFAQTVEKQIVTATVRSTGSGKPRAVTANGVAPSTIEAMPVMGL